MKSFSICKRIGTFPTMVLFKTKQNLLVVANLIVLIAPFLMAMYSVESSGATDNEFRCGSLQNAYGPLDYRSATIGERSLVEGAHFTPQVEQLIRGQQGYLDGDIDYTLRVFPNHPRALKSMMELGFRNKTDKLSHANWPVWCYFERAIRFKADDPLVRLVYAMYLHRKGKSAEVIVQLKEAEKLGEDSANLHYNMGLIYLDAGDFESSLTQAHKAYELGFQLEGLRNRLKRANKWREPQPKAIALDAEQTSNIEGRNVVSESLPPSGDSTVLKGESISPEVKGAQ